ncbi:MAG: entericidin A/B family lipoprotein [Opitutaceae bacterium]|nr:entericidin A/B family lipoprotein [Opitutaceae bacterium]
MKINLTKLLPVMAALIAAAFFTGCNTMDGAGKDVERAGEKLQDAANK